MRNIFLACLTIMIFLIACEKKSEVVKLEAGTPAYELAVTLTEKLPYLDPEKNNPLVTTKEFTISTGEVLEVLQTNLGERTKQLTQMEPDRIKNILVENAKQLAEKKMLLNAAAELNISATPADLDSAMEMNYKRSGGEERYAEFLKGRGLTLDFVKSEIQKGLTIQKYFDHGFEQLAEITEEDIEAAYQADKTASVRHILFSFQGKNDSEKVEIRKKAEEVLQRARNGEDFEKLVKEYSDDKGSVQNGGLYENFERGKMVKPFEEASFSIPVGQIGDLVETVYGYHIIKVVDRKKETRPLEEVHDQLKQQIRQQRQREFNDTELNRLHETNQFTVVEW